MQQKGLKLTAEDIYSVNQACLKDAIVIFGGGCTGEIVSEDGLLFTNYHCGHSFVRSHSRVDQDYLKHGFWAKGRQEELPCKGLSVSILKRMEDVTKYILTNIPGNIPESMRSSLIESKIQTMIDSIETNSHYRVEVSGFYYGNEYYLFVYEQFDDVRLVGAPTSGIGEFGGDTDNWVWPRHTGDFSIFRIYADTSNLPAVYSPDNRPYHPRKALTISLAGVKEDDFTMVYGYPYHTEEYITSFELENLLYHKLPQKIKLRRGRLDIIEEAMYSDPALYIAFASIQASIANGWKKWIGMEKGLEQRDAVSRKQEFEKAFIHWADSIKNESYKNLIDEYRIAFNEKSRYDLVYEYGYEVVLASILLEFVSSFLGNLNDYFMSEDDADLLQNLKTMAHNHFRFTYQPVEKESFSWLMASYYNDIPSRFHPEAFTTVRNKYKEDFTAYTEDVYNTSIFTDEERMMSFLAKPIYIALNEDPLFMLYDGFINVYTQDVYPSFFAIKNRIDSLNRQYMKAIMEMQAGKLIYPDANGSLRITYGKVEGYNPSDGIVYDYFTTLEGVMQKEDTTVHDYNVPQELKGLFSNKDYGRYGIDSIMPLCFVASNHTTGGNSGSPVLNAEGQLIGINFDRNWEGTMSDIMYNPEICRNISVDIRYVLFIIDKFAGADYLIDEMNIVE